MENKMKVSLTIINPKRRLSFQLFLYTFLTSVVIFFTTLVLIEDKIIYFIFGTISFISGLFVAYMREHDASGFITLDEHQIEVVSLGGKETVDIKTIKKIDFSYEGFDGESYLSLKAIGFKKGLNNYLTFYFDKGSKSFEILLKEIDLIRIQKLISLWEGSGVEVSIDKGSKKLYPKG